MNIVNRVLRMDWKVLNFETELELLTIKRVAEP